MLAGVTLVHPTNSFRMDGFIALLVGQKVPHHRPHDPPPLEREFWKQHWRQLAEEAGQGMTSEEALNALRTPGLAWGSRFMSRSADYRLNSRGLGINS